MSKLARSLALMAASLAVLGLGTTGVAAAGTSPHVSPASTHVRGHQPAASNQVQGSTRKTLRPTSIPMKSTNSTVAPNQKVALIGWLKSGHTSVPSALVTLEKRTGGATTFTAVSSKATDGNGKVILVVTPGTRSGQKVQYLLVFAGNTTYRGSHSRVITLTVG
jgi:hypothetical protein